jgi:hypothetical protein
MPSFITHLNVLVKKMHVSYQVISLKQKEKKFKENASWLQLIFP